MTVKLCRRLSPKGLAYCAVGLMILLCIYYASYTSDVNQNINQNQEQRNTRSEIILEAVAQQQQHQQQEKQEQRIQEAEVTQHPVRHKSKRPILYDTCPSLTAAEADINTVDVYKDFEFQVSEMPILFYFSFSLDSIRCCNKDLFHDFKISLFFFFQIKLLFRIEEIFVKYTYILHSCVRKI